MVLNTNIKNVQNHRNKFVKYKDNAVIPQDT